MKKGFTLIELLVVVLIIGILSAIALPQYQKAVNKTRFAQDVTVFNTLSKGIDSYILANRYPASLTWFTGADANVVPLDVSIPWSSCGGNDCIAPHDTGDWAAYCNSTECSINLWNSSLLDGRSLLYKRYPNTSAWVFGGGSTTRAKLICQLVRDFFGTDKMDDGLKTYCAGQGIE